MGNVGVDPRMRFVQTRPVAEFTLATNEPAYRTEARFARANGRTATP